MLFQSPDVAEPALGFSKHWDLLGPFQIGTRGISVNHARETSQGADKMLQRRHGALTLWNALAAFPR